MRSLLPVIAAVFVLFLFAPNSQAGSVVPTPVPVSPGAAETVRLTADRCPTFSWSGVPGAWGYEIAIFPLREEGADDSIEIDPESSEPLVHASVPAGTSSWTPSVEQCLVPGSEYSWFIREAGGFGRQAGAWSAASTFAVVESMLGPDQQREIDELIERLEALAVGFGEVSGDTTLQPEFIIDDVYNFLTDRWVNVTDARLFAAQARNHAANISTQVTGMAPQLQQIIDIVVENLEFLDASSSAPGLSTEASRRPVREAINEAKETLKYVVENAFVGKAEFVACESGSDCALLRTRLKNLLESFEDLVDVAGVKADLDLARLKTLIENIPAPALFPVHLIDQEIGITDQVDGLIASVEDIRELEPLLTSTPSPDSIDPCVWLEQDLVNRERNANIAGYGLKANALRWKVIGKLMGAASTTKIKPHAGVHGYAGATIETDAPETFKNIANGIENIFTSAGDKVLTTVSECKSAREQKKRDALIQSIAEGLPDAQLLSELEALKPVPADVVLIKTDVGLVSEGVDLVQSDVGLVKGELGLVRAAVDETRRVTDQINANLVAHDGKLMNLDTAVSALGDTAQDLRRDIEALGSENEKLRRSLIESHIAACAPTFDLLLPASRGGQVDTVIEIVETSIATASSVGINTRNSEKSFAKGEKSLAEEDYAAAFGWFCDAYQWLVK